MNDYQKLCEVIQAANPTILDLKFGCFVKTTPSAEPRPVIATTDPDKTYILKGRSSELYYDISPSQILGRPIRLADVLLAIESNDDVRTKLMDVSDQRSDLEAIGWFCNEWNPKDDNLDHQSEECKQFLISLLVNN